MARLLTPTALRRGFELFVVISLLGYAAVLVYGNDTGAFVASLGTIHWGWVLAGLGLASLDWIGAHLVETAAVAAAAVVMAGAVHFWARALVARRIARGLPEAHGELELDLRAAFLKGTKFWRPIWLRRPVGWTKRAQTKLRMVRDTVAGHIQSLNDRYADPSVKSRPLAPVAQAAAGIAGAQKAMEGGTA